MVSSANKKESSLQIINNSAGTATIVDSCIVAQESKHIHNSQAHHPFEILDAIMPGVAENVFHHTLSEPTELAVSAAAMV